MSHLFLSLVLFASAFSAFPIHTASTSGAVTPEAVAREQGVVSRPEYQLENLPYGETLVYRGRVERAGIGFNVGRATLRAMLDDEGRPTLEARAHGTKFGYELNTRICSTLDEGTLRPAVHEVSERGTERRTKKLVFHQDGASFLRLKHCKDQNCLDPTHRIKQAKMHGPIPWGTERVHCDDNDCRHLEHYAWQTRTEHRFGDSYYDLLSAVYIARQIEFSPEAEPVVIPIVNDTRRWNVRVHARREKRVEVAAGTFDAVELVLEPLPADDSAEKEEFSGLFGLNGAIHIWVDRVTRRPVLIEGTIPFAFLDLHAEIELEKIDLKPE